MKTRRYFGFRGVSTGYTRRAVKLFLGFFLLILLLIPTASAQDMMFRYDASRTGDYSPVAGTTGTTISQIWSYATGNAVFSGPTIANGVVYIGSFDDKVYALNASTGLQLWNFTNGGDSHSSPAVANGVVYVGSGNYNVYALNASTGMKLWNYTTGSTVASSPAVANG
ncbi:PQQ-binding-like beta-propeller repeat protein, partial [Methanoregula sp.]